MGSRYWCLLPKNAKIQIALKILTAKIVFFGALLTLFVKELVAFTVVPWWGNAANLFDLSFFICNH